MPRWFALFPVFATAAFGAELRLDFQDAPTNQPPPGFRATLAGNGKPGEWRVLLEELPPLIAAATPGPATDRRPVLAQLSRDPTDERFPLLIYEEQSFDDFTLVTRFKTVGGAVEQMAGIAFRVQDEKNFYVVRASSLGNTFKFYRVVNGQRDVPIGPDLEISKGVWHELRLECRGNAFDCWLNGKQVIPTLNDNTFASGKIAFWTKSDSVSYFGDTRIVYKPKEVPAQGLVRGALERYPRLRGLQIFIRQSDNAGTRLIASADPAQVGQPGGNVEADVIARDVTYYGKENGEVQVTLPLHDRNGESIAAVRVIMKSFPGQTEQNALARALPIVKRMEGQVRTAKDLVD